MPGAAQRTRLLVAGLRFLGGVDMLALIAVLMPREWMNVAAIRAGLEPLPPDPIVGYLARSAAMMYALHGLTIIYISFDIARYWPLVRFLAIVALIHGVVILAIDIATGMPMWWRLVEGPCFSATGLLVLHLMRSAENRGSLRDP